MLVTSPQPQNLRKVADGSKATKEIKIHFVTSDAKNLKRLMSEFSLSKDGKCIRYITGRLKIIDPLIGLSG